MLTNNVASNHSGKSHKRVNFTKEEDDKLKQLVSQFGETNNWKKISDMFPNRNIRQVKDRWTNYLSPNVINRPWNSQEDFLLIQSIQRFGRKWKTITQFFPGRTDIQIKSRFNVLQRKFKNEEKLRDNYLRQLYEKNYLLINKKKNTPKKQNVNKSPVIASTNSCTQTSQQQQQQTQNKDYFANTNSSFSIFSSNDYQEKTDAFPNFEIDYLDDPLFDTIDFIQDL